MKLIFILFLIFFGSFCFSQKAMSFETKPLPKFNFINNTVYDFCSSQAEYQSLSSQKQIFYYWVNYSRAYPKQFFDSVIIPITRIYPQLNGENLRSLKIELYSGTALPMFKLNPRLNKMAQDHSDDITSHNINPSHSSSNGDSFMDRFKRNSIVKCGAENISYGQDEPVFFLTLLYLDINVPNLGHRKTLLNPVFLETGIGSSWYKDGSVFLVEDFACLQN